MQNVITNICWVVVRSVKIEPVKVMLYLGVNEFASVLSAFIWLRRCATNRTVPGSIPVGVTGFFSDAFPSDGTMALGPTQHLVKMSTRNIPGGKGDRCVRLTTYHHTVPLSRNLGALTSQNPLGLFRPVTGQLYLYFPHLLLNVADILCKKL